MNNGVQALQDIAIHGAVSILMMVVIGFTVYFTVMIKYAKHLKIKNPRLPNAHRIARAKIAGLLCMAVTWLIIYLVRY